MISVENSNEFLAFIKENESVMAKFLMYKETLSESDYNELMSNVNDDDYLLDIINKADMLNDLQRLGAKMNSLLANTQYERLNQMEKIQLFNDHFEASNIVKVRLDQRYCMPHVMNNIILLVTMLKLNAVQQYWHVRV